MDGQANSVRGANAIRAVGGRISPEAEQATRDRLGPLADALLLDQQTDNSHARRELGWQPAGPALLTEMGDGTDHSAGSYRGARCPTRAFWAAAPAGAAESQRSLPLEIRSGSGRYCWPRISVLEH